MMMPSTPAAMREHMMAAPPAGHGADMPSDMPMADMQTKHTAAHADGAQHEHQARSQQPIGYEIRTADLWPDADYELRASPDGLTFDGYAAVYNLPSVRMAFAGVGDGKPFREVISPGAFRKTLAGGENITLRYQHSLTSLPLASTRGGTMELADDDRGLRVHATLPDNEWGRPVRDAIARGDIGGMSFRFQKVLDKWDRDASGGNVRQLLEVRLDKEVSVTEFPAFPDTTVAVRALADEAGVDPEQLIEALQALKPEARLTPDQRQAVIAVVNAHSDAAVIDTAAHHKLAQMRERLAARAG
jgi:HK97 family phage prohead protease